MATPPSSLYPDGPTHHTRTRAALRSAALSVMAAASVVALALWVGSLLLLVLSR